MTYAPLTYVTASQIITRNINTGELITTEIPKKFGYNPKATVQNLKNSLTKISSISSNPIEEITITMSEMPALLTTEQIDQKYQMIGTSELPTNFVQGNTFEIYMYFNEAVINDSLNIRTVYEDANNHNIAIYRNPILNANDNSVKISCYVLESLNPRQIVKLGIMAIFINGQKKFTINLQQEGE